MVMVSRIFRFFIQLISILLYLFINYYYFNLERKMHTYGQRLKRHMENRNSCFVKVVDSNKRAKSLSILF